MAIFRFAEYLGKLNEGLDSSDIEKYEMKKDINFVGHIASNFNVCK